MPASAGDLQARLSMENKQFLDALNQVSAAVDKQTKQSQEQFAAMGNAVDSFGAGLGKLAAGGFFVNFIAESIEAQAAATRAATGIQLLGDGAEDLIEQLDGLEAGSRFEFEQLAPAVEQMRALGLSAADAGKAIQAATDFATAFDKPIGTIETITGALARMKQEGEVSTKGITALVKEGIPAWDLLAHTLGTTVTGAQKAVKDGAIDIGVAFDALTSGISERSAEGAEKFRNSWEGQLKQINKLWGDLKETIGETVINALNQLKPVLETVAKAIADVTKWFANLPDPVKNAAVALSAMATAIVGVSGALTMLGPALAGIGRAFMGWPGIIMLVVTALVSIGTWVHANWDKIMGALTGGIATVIEWIDKIVEAAAKIPVIGSFFAGIDAALDKQAAGLRGVQAEYANTTDSAKQSAEEQIKELKKVFEGYNWFNENAQRLREEQQKQRDQFEKDAQTANITTTEKLRATLEERKKAYTELHELIKSGAYKGAAAQRDLAEASAAVADAQKKLSEGGEFTKKRHEESVKATEQLTEAYAALLTLSPELAAQFKAVTGALEPQPKIMAQLKDVADKMTPALKAAVTQASLLADTFTKLGIAGESKLTQALRDSVAGFEAVQTAINNGKATYADWNAAIDSVYAKTKALAEYQNRDLKKSYEDGTVTAQEYYDEVAKRAEAYYQKVLADSTSSIAAIDAAERDAYAKRKAASDNHFAEITKAYDAFGLSTARQLSQTLGEWNKFAETVKKTAGEGTAAAITADIKLFEALRAMLKATGQDTAEVEKKIKELQRELEATKTPAEKLAAAFTAIGVAGSKAMADAAEAAAKAAVAITDATGTMGVTAADAYASQQKLLGALTDIAEYTNRDLKDALDAGRLSQQQYWQLAIERAEEFWLKMIEVSDGSEAALAKIAAAFEIMVRAIKDGSDAAKKSVEDAFESIGSHSDAAWAKLIHDAEDAWDKIAAEAGEGSERALKAEMRVLELRKQQYKDLHIEMSKQDQERLEQLEKHFKKEKTLWDKFYDALKNIAKQAGRDIVDAIFGDERREFNKNLDEQANDLRGSLAERTTEWEQYQRDNAADMEQATADYKAALAEEEAETEKSLGERAQEYEEFAAKIQRNIDEIIESHRDEFEQERKDAADAIEDRRSDYEDYARDVAENIRDIEEKYADKLQDTTDRLREQLRDRAQDYEDFVDDATRSLSRLNEDTSDNIADETADTTANIADRKKDYDRYVEDTLLKIQRVREKNKGQMSDEEYDLQKSLARKKEDFDDYVAEQNRKLNEYVSEQQERHRREEEDLKTSLERRTRDQEQFLKENAAAQEKAHQDYEEGLAKDVGKQKDALAERLKNYEQFVADTQAQLDISAANHQKEQDKEIAQQQESLKQKKKDYDDHVTEILLKSEEQRGEIEKDYQDTTTALTTELGKQRTEYEKFKNDIIGPGGKLEQLKEAHRTLWGDIGQIGVDAVKSIGKELLYLVGEDILGKVMDGFKGFKGLLGDIGDDLTGIGGKLGDASSPPTSVPGGGGGGGGGAAGAVAGGAIGGWVSLISGAVTAISSVVGNFQMAGMNKSLDLIVNHTLRIFNELFYFRADAWSRWNEFMLIKDDLINPLNNISDKQNLSILKYDDIWTGLSRIETGITGAGGTNELLSGISAKLADMNQQPRAMSVNVTATGVTTEAAARALGNQIAVNLTTQLVPV